MSRAASLVFPYPKLSVLLALTWLLLNAPPTPGNALLAVLVGLSVPHVMRALKPEPVRIRAPGTIARLALVVLADVVRSNLDVARISLQPRHDEREADFISVPLELRDPMGLTVLAIILTATPGTLWVQFDTDTGRLLIHLLDAPGEHDWPQRIKDRYERPLLEIFA